MRCYDGKMNYAQTPLCPKSRLCRFSLAPLFNNLIMKRAHRTIKTIPRSHFKRYFDPSEDDQCENDDFKLGHRYYAGIQLRRSSFLGGKIHFFLLSYKNYLIM